MKTVFLYLDLQRNENLVNRGHFPVFSCIFHLTSMVKISKLKEMAKYAFVILFVELSPEKTVLHGKSVRLWLHISINIKSITLL